MEKLTKEEIKELLKDVVDLHLHTSPDVFPRKLDDIEAALQAKKAGLRGVVLKNHFFPTVDRALLGEEKTGFNLIGSITLNKTVGGINPHAVELAVRQGAKIVWMPTIHSLNTVKRPDIVAMFQEVIKPGEHGLSLLEEDRLIPEVCEILELIREADVALATGHIYPHEVISLVKASVEMKLKRIILTHPFSSLVGVRVDQVKELTNLSENIYVEFTCFDCCAHIKHPMTIKQMTHYISEVGHERVIITSDGGQEYNPYPVEMLVDMISQLLPYFSREGVRRMLVENPSYLISSS